MSNKAQEWLADSAPGFKAFLWLWLRFSVRRILSNPLRIVVVVLSVALATTLASAVLRVAFASISSFERSVSGGERPYQALLSPVGGRLNIVALAPCLRALAPHADLLAIRRETAVLKSEGRELAVRVAGIAVFGGDLASFEVGERYISSELAEKIGLNLPGSVRLEMDNHSAEITLNSVDQQNLVAGYADLAVAISDLAPSEALDSVAFRFKRPLEDSQVNSIGQWLSSCSPSGPPIRFESITAPLERGARLLDAYRLNILIMTAITLAVCMILVSQATQINLRSVVRELAILRTLGLSQIACLVMVLFESALLSALSAVIGVTFGSPLIVWIAGFLTDTASEIYNLSLENIGFSDLLISNLWVVLSMTGVGAVSALLGGREVITLAPYRGTRREQRSFHPLGLVKPIFAAGLASGILALAALIMIFAPSVFAAYATVSLSVVWTASCLPLLLRVAPSASYALRSYLPARIAAGNLKAAGGSFVLTGIAVSVSIALLVGLALMVGSFRDTLRLWSATRLAGDIFISTTVSGSGNDGRLSPEVLLTVQRSPDVQRAIPYYETTTSFAGDEVVLGGVDLATQCARNVYSFRAGSCPIASGNLVNKALASESAARKLGIKVNQEVSIADKLFTIAGIIQEFGTERPLIVIDAEYFKERFPGHNPETITVDLRPEIDPELVKDRLSSALPITVKVRNHRELLNLVETLFNRTFRITDSVRWIVFVLALLGVVSTVAQDLWDRRRELKISAVLGVSHSSLSSAITLEALAFTLAALFIGVVGGIGIGWCLTEFINPLVFGWTLYFSLSLWPLVEALLFGVSVACVTRVVAGSILKRIARSVRLEDE